MWSFLSETQYYTITHYTLHYNITQFRLYTANIDTSFTHSILIAMTFTLPGLNSSQCTVLVPILAIDLIVSNKNNLDTMINQCPLDAVYNYTVKIYCLITLPFIPLQFLLCHPPNLVQTKLCINCKRFPHNKHGDTPLVHTTILNTALHTTLRSHFLV